MSKKNNPGKKCKVKTKYKIVVFFLIKYIMNTCLEVINNNSRVFN